MAQIEFSEEQAMLLDTAKEFCRNKSPIATVRRNIETLETHDAVLWQEMVDLGWLGIAVPEAYGGLGMGVGSVVPVVEAMGEHLLGSPYLATTLALSAIVSSGSDEQKQAWLPDLVSGKVATVALTETDGSWLLDQIDATATAIPGGHYQLEGNKVFALDAVEAELIVASVLLEGQVRLVAIKSGDLAEDAIRREVVIDETRRSYSVSLDGVLIEPFQILPGADLESIERTALLLLSAEVSGGLSGVLKTIVEYLTTRKQFDRLIGSYQALKHPTVDILLACEAAKSLVYSAATLVECNDQRAEVALRMAKAQGSEAFAYAGDRAVQFHGGFGFTYDCDAQLFLRRALWCQQQFGDEKYHRQLLAPLLLDAAG